ncbi:F-box associated domain, type 3 [Dillenia turbinata]|uniref:F-box associated domain, type 3 n=1 Tax=Dillenia turbinata TaxID=194707 RepID=A0AAN8V024_9MAGN
MGSCDGLLLLFRSMNINEGYVCNPFVGDYVKLPNPISKLPTPLHAVVGFGFSSETNDYKVVVIAYYPRPLPNYIFSRVYVCGLSDYNWRVWGESPYLLVGHQCASKAVVNGVAHWVSSCPNKLIVSFDLGYEKFDTVSHPVTGLEGGNYSLGVLGGCLSVTDYSTIDCVGIWVMKEYGVKESWTKYVGALCFQNNDELLLLYNNQTLFSYNVVTTRFKKLSIRGLPHWFDVVPHVASLVSLSRNASVKTNDYMVIVILCCHLTDMGEKIDRVMDMGDSPLIVLYDLSTLDPIKETLVQNLDFKSWLLYISSMHIDPLPTPTRKENWVSTCIFIKLGHGQGPAKISYGIRKWGPKIITFVNPVMPFPTNKIIGCNNIRSKDKLMLLKFFNEPCYVVELIHCFVTVWNYYR